MAGDSNRRRRVAELLKRELAILVQQELDDPRVHGVTITAVEVSADLSSAKIYFTTLAEGEEVERAAVALNKAAGFLRRALRPGGQRWLLHRHHRCGRSQLHR